MAKGMSRRWPPRDARFSSEDAYQEMILSLLQRNIDLDRTYLRLVVMKDAARKKSIESSYLMRISESTYRAKGGAPSHVKHTGLTVSDLGGDEGLMDGSIAYSEQGFSEVDNRVALAQMLEGLSEKERARVLKWADNPRSVTGEAYYAMRATLDRLRERSQREEGSNR